MLGLVKADLLRLSSRRAARYGLAALCIGIVGSAVVSGARMSRSFVLAEHLVPTSRGIALAFALVAILHGCTATGADWGARTWWLVGSLEPRRLRVLLARYASGFVGYIAGFALIVVVLGLSFLGLAFSSGGGVGDGVHSLEMGSLIGVWGAGAYLTIWGGLLGMGLAYSVRNTAFGITLGLALTLGTEFVVRAFAPSMMKWSVGVNAQSLVGLTVSQPHTVHGLDGSSRTTYSLLELDPIRAVSILTGYLLVVLAVSFCLSRYRDIR